MPSLGIVLVWPIHKSYGVLIYQDYTSLSGWRQCLLVFYYLLQAQTSHFIFNLWFKSLNTQLQCPVSSSNAAIESAILCDKDASVCSVYFILPAFCRWSSTNCFRGTSRPPDVRETWRIPCSWKSPGWDVKAWINGKENFPSSRSSQKPFFSAYCFIEWLVRV